MGWNMPKVEVGDIVLHKAQPGQTEGVLAIVTKATNGFVNLVRLHGIEMTGVRHEDDPDNKKAPDRIKFSGVFSMAERTDEIRQVTAKLEDIERRLDALESILERRARQKS